MRIVRVNGCRRVPELTIPLTREIRSKQVVQASSFAIPTSKLPDADIDFGSGNAGKSFPVFVDGPSETSRNLVSLPPGAPPDCPLGNEAASR